ncbi:SGT1 [Candida jiufengensis]|uniref:SGT1 n=1 Tax=Candida jiufengensis TaxID=497108 RepID=UPI00222420BA|nr:SGT1 [Candida jiufengensis]KAI5952393.1 SGT1 [Candida jiufengensis]
MAVEKLIKQGQESIDSKDYLSAIQSLTQAIKENPNAFQAYLKRSTAYQKLKNYDDAKKDISSAFTIANERGKRSDIGICYFKLGLIYYQLKNLKTSLIQFQKAKSYDCNESTLDMWLSKCEYDLKNHPDWNIDDDDDDEFKLDYEQPKEEPKEVPKLEELDIDEEEKQQPKSATATASKESIKPTTTQTQPSIKSTNIDVINKIAPLNTKIRDDWYQTNEQVIITIYAKNVPQDKLDIKFDSNSLSISFPNKITNSEYNYNLDPLFDEINPSESSYKVYGTKLEIYLKKTTPTKWSTLEKPQSTTTTSSDSTPAYPTSSKKKINWNKFTVDDKEVGASGDGSNDFFQNIYKDMDEDSRRAMMKSYVQSNGTVLTTNWKEAKDKEFETSPPDGMVAKKWGQ